MFKKLTALTIAASILGTYAFAQETKDKQKADKQQEIIIRKKGDKDEKLTIVVDGDKVTINGKPVEEFKNEDITILQRDGVTVLAPRGRALSAARPGMRNLEELEAFRTGRSNRAILGVMTEKAEGGVKITEVTKESGAEKAGLKKDDVIIKVGDKKIETHEDLVAAIGERKPNEKVDVTYRRNGKEVKTTATLGEQPSRAFSFNIDDQNFNFEMPNIPMPPNVEAFGFSRRPKIGLQIQDLEEGKGVQVKDVDEESPAAKAGLKEGDVITQVNGKDVADVDAIRQEIKDLKEGDAVKFSYRRGGKNQTVEVKLPKRLKTANL